MFFNFYSSMSPFHFDTTDDLNSDDYLGFSWPDSQEDIKSQEKMYFKSIVDCIESIKEADELYGLEEILMHRCGKIDQKDVYLMPVSHPVIRLINEEVRELREKYTELQEEKCNMKWRIRNTLMSQYLKQREELYVYGTGQVYFISDNNRQLLQDECSVDHKRAVAWQQVGTLTSIDALRLIQKIKIRFKRGGLIRGNSEMHIAYIGDMGSAKERGRLRQYFREVSQRENEGESVPKEIFFTQLVRLPEYGEYIFEKRDEKPISDGKGKSIYNLSSLADMQELFRNFDMMLFFDESYFYKQRQTPKNLSERELKSHIQWCWKELERETWLAEKTEKSIRSIERYYYKEIYNEVGLWMNGYDKDRSSKLGFDRELFHIMQQAVDRQSDVYIYISRGKKIGDIDLVKRSVCNDERYDGKRLYVYRLAGSMDGDDNSVSEETENLLSVTAPMRQEKFPLAQINLWKLAKSIGRNFYEKYFDEGFSYHSMEIWEKTYLDLYVDKKEHRRLFYKLRYTLNMSQKEKDLLESFVKSYIDLSKEKKCSKHSPYVRNYLRNLLIGAMVTRSTSAIGIFYAYLLRKGFVDFEDIDKRADWIEFVQDENVDVEESSKIRGRRIIYSAIEGMEQVMLRDMEKCIDILKYDFRPVYCPEMDVEVFLKLLGAIREYCEFTGYKDSRLYMLTR